jgi:hypothetical protein
VHQFLFIEIETFKKNTLAKLNVMFTRNVKNLKNARKSEHRHIVKTSKMYTKSSVFQWGHYMSTVELINI